MSSPVALVTGGAGFIGSHLVDLLVKEGFCVRIIDSLIGGREKNVAHHSTNPLVTLDTRDIRELSSEDAIFRGVKYLFHFAGLGDIVPSIDKPTEYLSVNAQGTVQVLEGARFASVEKFVYAASSSCYGASPPLPTAESAPISPEYPYALSKYLGECSCLHWSKVYKLPVNSIRIFNAYGPRSRTTGAYGAVFGVFLKQKLAGKPFTVVGDGTQKRDFIFVTDVARAFYAAAVTPLVGRVYNIGAGNPQSVNRLVELLEGQQIEHLPKRPGEPDCTWADIHKITLELGWKPLVTFEEGVKRTVEHIKEWEEAPLWDKGLIEEATKSWFTHLNQEEAGVEKCS